MGKTKIIATVGPSTNSKQKLKELILKGCDAIRINMRQCDYTFCDLVFQMVDELNKELNTCVSIILDTNGPDLRIGLINEDKTFLKQDTVIRIYKEDVLGDETKFSVNYEDFVNDVKLGNTISINDGAVELVTEEKCESYLKCRVIKEGFISSKSDVHVVGIKLNIPFLQAKDKETVEFASTNGIDFLSLSFVRNSDDVLSVTDMLIELGNDHMEVLSKIENNESYEDIDEILKISDGAIVARGDLGVEVPMENIPLMQKNIINKCHLFGKVVIVSTDFLSSMENDMMPTRAEVSDVANAVLDGTDAIMLSGETTVGKHPVEVLKIMEKIIKATETGMPSKHIEENAGLDMQDITGSVAYSVAACASKLSAVAIVTPTISGYTAKKIGKLRSNCPVVAISPSIDTVKSLALHYGVQPVLSDGIENFDDIINMARDCTKAMMKVNEGDKIIITGGYPFSKVKHTNFMKIEEL